MRRLNPGRRVLDHQAFVCQHRIALPQQITDPAERRDKPVRLGLTALDVVGRDNVEKQIAKSRAPKNRLSLDTQRAGRDHQGKSIRTIAHKLLRPGIEHVALGDSRLIDSSLARDQLRDMRLARILAILAQNGREAIVIIEPNQPCRVILKPNLDPVSTQNLVESGEMQRLSINQRPVKIEYHCANHTGVLSYTRA